MHRGAEKEVFPICKDINLPVVTYTALRWSHLLKATPKDPPNFKLPTAQECYAFALDHPQVSITLCAPDNRTELLENLQIISKIF